MDGRKVTWPPTWPPPLFKEKALDMDTHLQLYGKLPAPSGMATFSQVKLRAVTEALHSEAGHCPLRGSFSISRECSALSVNKYHLRRETFSVQSAEWPQLPQHNPLQFASIQAPCSLQCVRCADMLAHLPQALAEKEQNPAQGHWADAEPMNEANPGPIPLSPQVLLS